MAIEAGNLLVVWLKSESVALAKLDHEECLSEAVSMPNLLHSA
jgi:hypothetical protein